MFDSLDMAPPDAIMGLTEAFRSDPNPRKVNLTIGVYMDEGGTTPIFSSVKKAEERMLREESTKSYVSIEGSAEYGRAVQALLLGEEHPAVASGRAVTADTPGGTCALRVGADLLKDIAPDATVWLSEPTWPNHPSIFEAAGIPVKRYPYYDVSTKSLDFEALMTGLNAIPSGDVVLLHGCCHNPTGVDPSPEQWEQIVQCLVDRGLVPFVDFAYQGLGDGLDADAIAARMFSAESIDVIISSSCSKNFGLYRERTGALTLVTKSKSTAARAMSHMKRTIRANYSNPPAHGATIVTTILGDAALRSEWESEVAEMCERIAAMRRLFVETLKAKGVAQDFSFLENQRGMFSFSGLTAEQVDRLREEYSIYIVRSGRINVASMNESNMDYLCESVAAVV